MSQFLRRFWARFIRAAYRSIKEVPANLAALAILIGIGTGHPWLGVGAWILVLIVDLVVGCAVNRWWPNNRLNRARHTVSLGARGGFKIAGISGEYAITALTTYSEASGVKLLVIQAQEVSE